MSRIHLDHAGPFQGKYFLIIIDAYSKWMDVQIVNSTSTDSTIAKLCTIEQIVSDNRSAFTSHKFKRFLAANGLQQILTFPSSNGTAERAVQTFKNAVIKLEGPMEVRLSKCLFKYRVTPHTRQQACHRHNS